MKHLSRTAGLILPVILGGCSVGPDFQKHDPAVSPHWHESVTPRKSHPDETAPVEAQWWKLYQDPVLTALEQDVLTANLDLKEAALHFEQSRAERRIAAAARLPHAQGAASYARERASTNGILSLLGTEADRDPAQIADGTQGFGPAAAAGPKGNPAFNLPQYGLSASWEVDLWGHVRRQVEAATASMKAMQEMQRDTLVSLMAETAQDYIALRNVQAQTEITHQSLDIAHHSVELTVLRVTQGTATKLDLAYARGQLHGFEARLPQLHREEVHLLNALAFLMAREPGALSQRLAGHGSIPPLPASIPVGLPSQLAERRPDIRAAQERLHAATATIGVAMADFFPRITLSGSLDVQALQFSGLGSWASRQYGFGPTVTIPLFEGGKLAGQLALRRLQEKEAAIALQRTVLHAWEEVDDAMADLGTAQERHDRLSEAVTESETAVQVAQLQYAQGAGDFLNVLTTQNGLLESRSALSDARAEVAVSMARLYRALGGGWTRS
ncbi:efflux transporter outer membrane subunit [Asaia siamensis]|uniref:efflux transporter outer membrane subunit n=1 Tax=Asaia TaxID=91914 RepID=UPI0016645009|nr:efflux transporter outer membrane subunit [Asaia siamensis]GBR06905.1 secretion system type I outer membrane efflux pump lipoprotein NodT [Asaia siamensis NRIC 0323]